MTKESIPKARHRRSLTVGHITQANADSSLLDYEQFLQNKIAIDNGHGWAVEPHAIHPVLKPHQRDIVLWALRGGRRAVFASFGLGKTIISLEILRQIQLSKGGRMLIVAPLGVRQEFKRDGLLLGLNVRFIRRIEEAGDDGIYITNYETIRDGKLDPTLFTASVLDEASCLRGFGGTKTFREFMRVFAGIKYKFVATATPSPNEYIELLAYSAYLEIMEVSEAKAQPLDAKVLTPGGWKPMGEIKVGDDVIAGDGTPTKVVGVYPQGEQEIYRITCSDGATTECTGDHLWLTTTHYERNNRKRYLDRNPEGEKQYETVKTTDNIRETLLVKNGSNHAIPTAGMVEQNRRNLTVNPYLLGALIGDGCLRDTSIVFSTADEWMVNKVESLLPTGLFLRETQYGSQDYSITATGKKGGNGPRSNPLLSAMRQLGLLGKRSHEKFIPTDYLESNADDRLALLRGLMDTDGTTGANRGQTTFCTTSKQLADDVIYLVRSLGGLASARHASSCDLTKNQALLVEVRMVECPFELPRKADKYSQRNVRATTRYITRVDPVGRKQAQCIAVNHPSRLYVTDDFIVTHNTRFFKRNSEKADQLTIHPHKEKEFWLWVSSWGIFVNKPSDLGHSNDGYLLPEMQVIYHETKVDHSSAGFDTRGQKEMFREATKGVVDASRERRESLPQRLEKMMEIISDDPDSNYLIWHDLEREREAIEKAVPSAVSVYGSQGLEEREQAIIDFSDGKFQYLAAKPVIAGSGCNFQRHCHKAIFLGIGFKFNDFIQAIHRIHRFLQDRPVEIHIIYAESERAILRTLQGKWARHVEMVEKMTKIIEEYGLSEQAMQKALVRSIGVDRVESKGHDYTLVNNDTVLEMQPGKVANDSVGLVLTSIPFSTQYEYTPSYNDFGHTDSNDHFWEQMDYLTPNLLRVLQPGRLAIIHVKDRVVPGGLTGLGFQTVYPFHVDAIMHFQRHGFAYLGMKTIVTDVVRENNQTYRLGWSEQCKDGTKMGVGMPEYLLLFRKPPTSNENSYADNPVVKSKHRYTRSRWQIDAHAFTRSDGNRGITPEEIEDLPHDVIFKLFRDFNLKTVYDFEHHVKLGEALEAKARLPVTFMLLQPPSWHPDVWSDVARMLTQNLTASQKGKEMHLCLSRDSLVLTKERGYVPIQDVQIGEHSLTHLGRWRRILNVKMTGVQPVVTVYAQGSVGITLTPDHKLWARKSEWVRKRQGAERTDPCWIEAENTLGGYLNMKITPDEMESSMGDETLWWNVGRWLADGHIDKRGCAIVSVGKNKWDYFVKKSGRFGGNKPYEGTAYQVRLRDRDREIRSILNDCGRGAKNKRIPHIAFGLPSNLCKAIIDGYLSGDGHFVESRNTWMMSSTSRQLLLGMSILVQKAYGSICSIFKGRPERHHSIEGRHVCASQEWLMSFSIDTKNKKPFVLDDGAWKRVRKIVDAGVSETWCLKVEDDESFTAEGVVVKNCPMQWDIADRCIEQFTNPGELVLDPFSGIGTVPLRAIKLGRKGYGVELNPRYWFDSVSYCQTAEREMATPDLFSAIEAEDSSKEAA